MAREFDPRETQEIVDKLAADIEGVMGRLMLHGKRHGREIKISAGDSPIGSTIAVVVSGPKQGVVLTPNATLLNGKNAGGALHLIAAVQRCTMAEAFDWARNHLNMAGGRDVERKPPTKKETESAERAKNNREMAALRDRQRRHGIAAAIWSEGVDIHNTAAAAYFHFRGISPDKYGRDVLRFHGALTHPSGHIGPAVICRCQDKSGDGRSLWRIWIQPDGKGRPAIDPSKMGLGQAEGAAVRLGDVAAEIGVAEGVETAMAVREILDFKMPVWSLLSTSGFSNFIPPEGVKRVVIFPDGDIDRWNDKRQEWIKAPGMRAAMILEKRLLDLGYGARIEAAPDMKKDYCDILKEVKIADGRYFQQA